jgi:hypothetical protein
MANQRLRPGTWSIVNSGATTEKFRIDWEPFEITAGGTVEFMVENMALYNDTNLTAYRNPVKTTTLVTNLGENERVLKATKKIK